MFRNRFSDNLARGRSLLLRSGMAMVLVLIFAAAASAYTLVFRNGQRIEIPDEFTLTRTTLTYEISPGFQKTILLSLIDIGATERANNEPWGSFHKRRQQQQSSVDPQPSQLPQTLPPSPSAVKTVTNSDLAAIRQRRLESERAYEQRRLQLGLPTVAESRRRQAEEEGYLREQLRERSLTNKQEERYWRTRARELRTEIAMVDNQINYVRSRLAEVSESSPVTGSWTSTYPIWPDYGPWSRDRRGGRRDRRQNPPIFGPQYPYGYPPGQYPNGYPPGQNPYGYPRGPYPYGYPTGQYPYGYPTGPSRDAEKSAQEADLTRRLDDLLVTRAGLVAQWQALESEARDARVPQIWLEP